MERATTGVDERFEIEDASSILKTLEDVARALTRNGTTEYVAWSDGERPTLAVGVRARLLVEGRTCAVRDGAGRVLAETATTDPFADAGRLLGEAIGGPFRAWGYLGYGLAGFQHPYARTLPTEMHLIVPELTCHLAGDEVVLEGAPAVVSLARAALDAAAPLPYRPARGAPPSAIEGGRDVYEAAVREVLEALRAAKVEKVILARRVTLPGRLDALATFHASAQTQAARRFAFALGSVVGVGLCPEILLVADEHGHVMTNPLAGTQPRGKTPEEDARVVANLLRDAKEVSEHALSIRLAYEEMGRVCTPETLRVIDFMRVKTYPFTHHLSSRAAGTLAPGRSSWDALREVFPGVTSTGIGKRDALALIDRLETSPRGVYGGAMGWVAHTGALDWGLTLRSAFDYGSGVTLNAGAGIVSDSDPAYEFDESAHKMRTMGSRIVFSAD
ncbi:salicylate synthase [soil metagenome]